MKRELLVAASPGEVRGVVLEDRRPVELLVERDGEGGLVGALFLGRILRVVPSLPGAFIELGADRPAFLPGEALPGGGRLIEGAAVLVQVVKDPQGDKAAEVTAAPSFHGKLTVWTPGRPGLAVSRQIIPAERARLSGLLAPLLQPGEGLVVRSHAAGAAAQDFASEISRLRADHAALIAAIAGLRPPSRLDPGPGPLERVIEAGGPDLAQIWLEDRESLAAARTYLARRTPALVERLQLGEAPLFLSFGLEGIFDQAITPRVTLAGGGEIVIETVTAATLIDVNLAAATGGRGRAGEAIRRVNLAAAAEIGRQLRLRNIAGAVLIDFITMRGREERQAVEAAFEAAAAVDPVAIEIHGWTRLGHLEITRKRGGAPLADRLLGPTGVRRAKSPTTVALEALRQAARARVQPGPIELHVARSVAAELDGRLNRHLIEAQKRCGRRIVAVVDPDRDPETFDLAGG